MTGLTNNSRISTHGSQGATKKGIIQNDQCIVYTGPIAPAKLAMEKKMHKDPIQMIPINPQEKLDPLSRTDLAKIFPVEHNVKLREVGMVSNAHLKKLIAYVKSCQ